MVKGSQSYYDRIRAMTEIGHTTLDAYVKLRYAGNNFLIHLRYGAAAIKTRKSSQQI